MEVYTYLRVSGASQIDGDGFERQAASITKFCEAHALIFGGAFQEKGVSGTVEGLDRPAFSELLAYAEKHEVKAFVVERMDRLARDLMVSEVLLAECRKRGLKVFAADQGALIDMASDGGDPTRVLIRQIMGALAQWEKSNLVMKLRAARDRVRAKTGKCEGRKPYGETAAGKHLRDTILNLKLAGWSYGRIAVELNRAGYQTRTGTPWQRTGVAKFVQRYKNIL